MREGSFDFTTTQWSVISAARQGSPEALERLARSYQGPLRAYVIALGHTDDADDLLQEFFANRFLREGFLDSVQPRRQPFRAFLKRCLRNFITDRKDPRRRRPPPGFGPADISLQAVEAATGPTADAISVAAAAEQALDRAWAKQLLARARDKLAAECARAGRTRLRECFDRVLEEDPDAPSHREVAARCGMSEGAVGVAFHRMRERLKVLLLQEIRETVASAEAWEEERRHLLAVLSDAES